jgi:ribosomal protein S12 methylthiotransferase accessory factor
MKRDGAPGRWPALDQGDAVQLAGGTARSLPLAQTKLRLAPLLAGYGITRVAELTGLDALGVPVFSAVRPGAATLAVSAGKGLERDAAWVSAVMESIEVEVAEQYRAPCIVRACGVRLDPGYRTRELNLHPVSLVDDETVLDWTAAWNLVDGQAALIPSAAVGLRGWTSARWKAPLFVTTSNGLAAGNDALEAALHGLLELVERHALSQADALPRQAIDPARVGARLAPVVARCARMGAVLDISLLTSLSGTAACICYLSQPDMPQLFGGSGCHLDPAIALERALLEALQSRVSMISGLRDDIAPWRYAEAALAAPVRQAAAHRALAPLPAPGAPLTSLRAALDTLVATVSRYSGRPVLAVQLSADGAYPAVVQVFAPGLQASPHAPGPATPAGHP